MGGGGNQGVYRPTFTVPGFGERREIVIGVWDAKVLSKIRVWPRVLLYFKDLNNYCNFIIELLL